ncbi:aldo/keto reductase [Cerasicoccus frondis]|uniref:aldo/keto reductase n=1 Tax=Cerasicoccus frondis TaxID=490090 RepID=UPI002852AA5D|nr:aldo/keto reductase [Cerasicoccus frondis]
MKTKILGRTGIEVPIVGLGTAFLGIPTPNQGRFEYRDGPCQVDVSLGEQTVAAALDAGYTFFDTAALYGRTKSESMIGKVFRQKPEQAAQCLVTTKVGRHYGSCDYSFDGIIRHVNEGLERLGLERLEIVYIHDAMDQPMREVMAKNGALGALRHLQKTGVVRYVGTAANNPATNIAYIESGEFDAAVIADSYSLLNQLAEERIFPAAEKHKVGLVVATPLERGLLATGPLDELIYHDRNFSVEVMRHAAQIKRLCDDYRVPMAAVSLQWVTRHPLVATTVPGARVPQEAVENWRAAEIEIPSALWADLMPLIQSWDLGIPY